MFGSWFPRKAAIEGVGEKEELGGFLEKMEEEQ
jgi:hypothetical protein